MITGSSHISTNRDKQGNALTVSKASNTRYLKHFEKKHPLLLLTASLTAASRCVYFCPEFLEDKGVCGEFSNYSSTPPRQNGEEATDREQRCKAAKTACLGNQRMLRSLPTCILFGEFTK